MEIVVNRNPCKALDVRIEYGKFYNQYLYFIEVKCDTGKFFYENVIIDVFKSAEDAIKRYEYLKDNINSDLVIER